MKYYFDECLSVPEPENIAILMKQLYGKEFRCLSIKNKTWEAQRDGNWRHIEEGYSLYQKISTDILRQFEKYQLELEQKNIDMRRKLLEREDLEENEILESNLKKVDNCKKICKLLKNISFKNKVMKECSVLFYYEREI